MPQIPLLSALSALLFAASTVHATPLPISTAPTSTSVLELFKGQGHIYVLNGSDFATVTPADRIGCVDKNGFVTASDCAVFSRDENEYHHVLSTTRGNCSFVNPAMPQNTRSYYGKGSYAWSCADVESYAPTINGEASETYYTVDGFHYPFVCQAEFDCLYEIPSAPSTESPQVPMWQWLWGDMQEGPGPGNSWVILLWQPIKNNEAGPAS